MSVLDAIISEIPSLPPLPQTVQKLVVMLNDPDVDIDALAEVIQYDQSITTGLLKLSNSAFFGVGGTIGSVKQAVTRLGTKNVFQMIMTTTCGGMLKSPHPGYDLAAGELWRHSVGAAIASDHIASVCSGPSQKASAMAFTAGLLHDVGKVIMDAFVGDQFPELLDRVDNQDVGFNEAEIQLLGIDHAEVGARLAEAWNLPASIVAAIRYHHRPADAGEEDVLVPVVHVGDSVCLAMGLGLGGDGLYYTPDTEAMTALGFHSEQFDEICGDTVAKLLEVEQWFEGL